MLSHLMWQHCMEGAVPAFASSRTRLLTPNELRLLPWLQGHYLSTFTITTELDELFSTTKSFHEGSYFEPLVEILKNHVGQENEMWESTLIQSWSKCLWIGIKYKNRTILRHNRCPLETVRRLKALMRPDLETQTIIKMSRLWQLLFRNYKLDLQMCLTIHSRFC